MSGPVFRVPVLAPDQPLTVLGLRARTLGALRNDPRFAGGTIGELAFVSLDTLDRVTGIGPVALADIAAALRAAGYEPGWGIVIPPLPGEPLEMAKRLAYWHDACKQALAVVVGLVGPSGEATVPGSNFDTADRVTAVAVSEAADGMVVRLLAGNALAAPLPAMPAADGVP